MNAREKILASIVGVFLIAVVGYFLYSQVIGSVFGWQTRQIANLEIELEKLKELKSKGTVASTTMTSYAGKSLPQSDKGQSLYHSWLYDVTSEIGMECALHPKPSPGRRGIYEQNQVSLTTEATLDQLTEFLYRFYNTDFLHRISRLNVQPIRDSRDLQINITIDVLSLPGAPDREQLEEKPSKRLRLQSQDEYLTAILDRNLFGPENNPPSIGRISSQRVYTNERLSLTVKATDSDKLDRVTISKGDDAPEDSTLSNSGNGEARFSWTPREEGRFQVTFFATDDGFPNKTDEQTVDITVTKRPPPPPRGPEPDPPPERPKFNMAKYTVLTTVVKGRDGREQVWLFEQPTDRTYRLYEGDDFSIGLMKGTIQSINVRQMIFTSEGETYILEVGNPLAEADKTAQPLDGL